MKLPHELTAEELVSLPEHDWIKLGRRCTPLSSRDQPTAFCDSNGIWWTLVIVDDGEFRKQRW